MICDVREIGNVYSFTRAAVMKYHGLNGLQQQKCILSQV